MKFSCSDIIIPETRKLNVTKRYILVDVVGVYEKLLLIGDFNAEVNEPLVDSFLYEHDLDNLVKEKTRFKNIDNLSCIDLILTNNNMAFQNTTTVSTGLSDFHKLVLTVLKTTITKTKPHEII